MGKSESDDSGYVKRGSPKSEHDSEPKPKGRTQRKEKRGFHFPRPSLRSKKAKTLAVGILALLLFGNFYSYYQGEVQGSVVQANHDQKVYYDSVVQNWQNYVPSAQATATNTSSDLHSARIASWYLSFGAFIFYSASGHGTEENQTLIRQGYTPDCITQCKQGINYFMDPTTIITDQGRGVEQCSIFQGTGITDTCTTTNIAKYEGWTVGRVPTVNTTDTWASTHSACTTNEGTTANKLITDANGLRDVAGTVTSGANGATVTTTIAKTFSITGTYTGINVACLLSGTGTNADSGTNPLIYAESTFGPDSFVSGDSLTGTWSIART